MRQDDAKNTVDATRVAAVLTARGLTISTAESCTGGLLAKLLTDIPGSSTYFIDGVVTYANSAKQRLLGVSDSVLRDHGAVSSQCAVAMAFGCRAKSQADYALATTGIAGPTGGTPGKPVGLVYIAVADRHGCQVRELRLDPDLGRDGIRRRTAECAFDLLLSMIGLEP